jgi:hypothetical protein
MPALGTAALSATIDSALRLGLPVLAWRYAVLERVGFSTAAAIELAENADVDLHVACDLLNSGCPEELALRILN